MAIKKEIALTGKQNRELFRKFKNGDLSARDEIITGNINIIYYTLFKFFKNLEPDDYFDIGAIGLTKAVDSYDVDKDYEFLTFAVRCVKNEILMELRKTKKDSECLNLNDVISTSDEGDSLLLDDILQDPDDLIDALVEKISYNTIINKIFAMLNDEEKELLKLYFGFYGKRYTYGEIAMMYGFSYSGMVKKISKICRRIKENIKINISEIKNDLLV